MTYLDYCKQAYHVDMLEEFGRNKKEYQEERARKTGKRKLGTGNGFVQNKISKSPENNFTFKLNKKSSKEFQAIYDEAIIEFVAKQHVSFSQVSGDSWKQLMDVFVKWKGKIPEFQVRSNKTVQGRFQKGQYKFDLS